MHLKKLELFGFKSFADRTEFSFQSGMTSIVGPNGCGKSNVVDAFKWIFGEQSAKGMRGSEMRDVIFSGTQRRKPTGFAEVTVVFDNQDSFLDIDYSEVAITRRLFRSGESEYLINREKCRLKDIKELVMDTGMGRTSYSILEQGKIDVLLQASQQERRLIFEEAAGISKFRAKKGETLRALARVEENLTRLADIIQEVEKRVQRLKAQASKARRYRVLVETLKELRIRAAAADYRDSVEARTDLAFRLHWAQFQVGRLEGVVRELLDPEADAFLLDIDVEHNDLDLCALFVVGDGLFPWLRPVEIGQMNQAIDAAVEANEHARLRGSGVIKRSGTSSHADLC